MKAVLQGKHTDDTGIVTEEEARGTDEEAEEVGSEGAEPCAWEVDHDGVASKWWCSTRYQAFEALFLQS